MAPVRTENRVEFRFAFPVAASPLNTAWLLQQPCFPEQAPAPHCTTNLAPIFTDGPDVIEYLSEIPLPGRLLAPPSTQAGTRSPESTSFGFIAGAENRLVASAVDRLMQPAL